MLTVALDTSVLVAGLVQAHPKHVEAARWLRRAPKRRALMAAHALAEAWATLTAMPLVPRISADQADAMLRRLRHIEVIAGSKAVYVAAIERCRAHALRSGAIYDALHLITAERSKADELVTLNAKDFLRLKPAAELAVRTPE